MPSTSPRVGSAARGFDLNVHGDDYEGFVGIDTIVHGRSAGGVRIADDLALDEIRALASEMSLKYALFHLPRGGAKAGIRMPSSLSAEDRREALMDFGRQLAPILCNGIYSPGMDMNCGPEDLQSIYRGAGIEVGAITDTSWFTAISVYHALQAAAATLDRPRPLKLAVEGFGSVARHLSDRLDPSEFSIEWVATLEGAVHLSSNMEPTELAALKAAQGDHFVLELDGEGCTRDDVLRAPADIVLPSSRTWVIDDDIAREFSAEAIVPIANAPFTGDSVEILHDRGVALMPGYLSNCGGVLASSLFDQGIGRREVEALFAEEFRPIVDGVLEVAKSTRRPGTEIAEAVARAHMGSRPSMPQRSLVRRVYERFLARKMPRAWRARQARAEFVRNSRSVVAELAAMQTMNTATEPEATEAAT
jgi:glutamate dehydrogenase (NAD(P)+)